MGVAQCPNVAGGPDPAARDADAQGPCIPDLSRSKGRVSTGAGGMLQGGFVPSHPPWHDNMAAW